ncbi:bifunctional ADP-dependent NAD(P)H-hydrate dehydratase/NAD(P)H-hydrate epimerase [Nocardia sp. NPDC058658]|uniref:bifunctional ADP-dependent NAD(P)H-hydrate dehydratase/NAD(P)H-hydrate epimerase n=1 Tax=Nocardia sp. NPDC058658 TaxID=3346580 RepID=UPI003656301A
MSDRRGYYTVDEVRAAEAELFTRVPAGMPMRRAAYGLAGVVVDELRSQTGGVVGRTVGLLVGSGDNGGDALWAGVFLRRRGVRVAAVLLNPERAHGEGLAALRAAGGRVVDRLDGVDLVIDGIVGISGRGPLRSGAAEIVAAVNVPIVSADLPSGVDPDTGAVDGPAVTADVTVAFGAYKPVHALAVPHCGRIVLVPIGLRLGEAVLVQQLEPAAVGAGWPVPGPADDKYSQGVTGVCAGSAKYPGAGVLCTGGAVVATSGMVRYVGTDTEVLEKFPEVVASSVISETGRVQAWVFGPGGGTDSGARDRLAEVLGTDLPVLVDADGLTILANEPGLVRGRSAPTVLTPHAGEFARLTGAAVGDDRVRAVRGLAQEWGVTVLLKGRATVIASPGEVTLVNDAGGDWAATPGSGDVLSGIIGALLAAGREAAWAAAAGARVHALAAELAAHEGREAGAPISATPLLRHVRDAVRMVRSLAASSDSAKVPRSGYAVS